MNPVYIIEDENLQMLMLNLDNLLGKIEVRGDSVQYLFGARNILKEIFDKMKKKEEGTVAKEEGG